MILIKKIVFLQMIAMEKENFSLMIAKVAMK